MFNWWTSLKTGVWLELHEPIHALFLPTMKFKGRYTLPVQGIFFIDRCQVLPSCLGRPMPATGREAAGRKRQLADGADSVTVLHVPVCILGGTPKDQSQNFLRPTENCLFKRQERKKKDRKRQEAFRERRHLHVCDLWPWRLTLTLVQGQENLCH